MVNHKIQYPDIEDYGERFPLSHFFIFLIFSSLVAYLMFTRLFNLYDLESVSEVNFWFNSTILQVNATLIGLILVAAGFSVSGKILDPELKEAQWMLRPIILDAMRIIGILLLINTVFAMLALIGNSNTIIELICLVFLIELIIFLLLYYLIWQIIGFFKLQVKRHFDRRSHYR